MTAENETFRAENHVLATATYFEDLLLGQEFVIPSRTVTEAHLSAFQAVSGDNHPIHYDLEYCRAHGHDGFLIHGLQALCYTAAGAGMFPHLLGDALVAFIEQSSRFLKPIYVGDTVYPRLAVTELKEQTTTGVVTVRSTVHNQRGECCLEGEQKYLVKRRPA